MRDVLRRFSTYQPFARESLFDVPTTTENAITCSARVASKLPSSVSSGDRDFVSKLLNLAGQFGAVNCGREALRAIDFNGIEAAPLPIPGGGSCWRLPRACEDEGRDRSRL